jgi:Zn finger protein HypA/HybF involved in hydrogenase expression
MHELSLVEELVAACRERAQGTAVREVWVRYPESLDAEELLEGFALAANELAVSAGDACLARSKLTLEPVPVLLECPCGFEGQLSPDHVAGHMSICPRCGQVGEAADGLELVRMSFCASGEPFGPT